MSEENDVVGKPCAISYPGLTNAMLDCVFDQPSTLPHQLYLMLSSVVEKIEAFFGVNF